MTWHRLLWLPATETSLMWFKLLKTYSLEGSWESSGNPLKSWTHRLCRIGTRAALVGKLGHSSRKAAVPSSHLPQGTASGPIGPLSVTGGMDFRLSHLPEGSGVSASGASTPTTIMQVSRVSIPSSECWRQVGSLLPNLACRGDTDFKLGERDF